MAFLALPVAFAPEFLSRAVRFVVNAVAFAVLCSAAWEITGAGPPAEWGATGMLEAGAFVVNLLPNLVATPPGGGLWLGGVTWGTMALWVGCLAAIACRGRIGAPGWTWDRRGPGSVSGSRGAVRTANARRGVPPRP